MAGVTLYYDGVSQPCRAVQLLLEVENIPYTLNTIQLFKGDNKSDEFGKISFTKSVPAIQDGAFCLAESGAILRYLAAQYKAPDHWYPQNAQKRARIDEYLDWHHTHTRKGCAQVFLKHILPGVTGQEPNKAKVEEAAGIFENTVIQLESYFLKDTKFISSSEISIADLVAVCEFTQFYVTGEDPIKDKPRLHKWFEDCKEALSPHFDKAHERLYRVRDEGFKILTE